MLGVFSNYVVNPVPASLVKKKAHVAVLVAAACSTKSTNMYQVHMRAD